MIKLIIILTIATVNGQSSFDEPEYFAKWINATGWNVPFRSVWGILSYWKEIQYICRAYDDGDLIPGFLIQSNEGCLIVSNNSIYIKMNYQTMIPNPGTRFIWKQSSEIPSCAFPTGRTSDNKVLYSGMLINPQREPYIGHVDAENRVMVYAKNNIVQLEMSFNILCTQETGVISA